jgi:DNA primase
MSNYIPQEKVDEVKRVMKVEEVISEFVHLKKAGASYKGECPFHGGNSFTVTPAKNIYKCFGCDKSGNAITFLMDHKKMSYPEAIKFLMNKYNIFL